MVYTPRFLVGLQMVVAHTTHLVTHLTGIVPTKVGHLTGIVATKVGHITGIGNTGRWGVLATGR